MTTSTLPIADADRLAPTGCNVRLFAERRLRWSSYAALSRVACEFHSETGVLRLRGSLSSYYLKQVAQELVLDLEGVRLVDNQIRVARPSPRAATRHPECPIEADAASPI